MKTLIGALAILILGTGCSKYCERANSEIIQPTQKVARYLQTNPSGQQLGQGGCAQIIDDFKDVPAGSQMIRELAQSEYSHVRNTCLQWRWAQRQSCYYERRGNRRIRRCHWEDYRYCARWQSDVVREPGYATLMQLSANLDQMFDYAHATCGDAELGKHADAYQKSRALLGYILSDVRPIGERVWAMTSCEKEQGSISPVGLHM